MKGGDGEGGGERSHLAVGGGMAGPTLNVRGEGMGIICKGPRTKTSRPLLLLVLGL